MFYSKSDTQQAVRLLLNRGSRVKREMQEMVELASYICQTPMAVLSLVDRNTHYLPFAKGLKLQQIALEDSFCQYMRKGDSILVIPDASIDQRFYDNKLVATAPYIRFYAGVPLVTIDGDVLGSLDVYGTLPKNLSESQKQRLKILALRVVELIDADLKQIKVA